MQKRRSIKARRELVDKWRASGLSRKDFCADVGISTRTLGLWLKLPNSDADLKFLKIIGHDRDVRTPEQAISGEIILACDIKSKRLEIPHCIWQFFVVNCLRYK